MIGFEPKLCDTSRIQRQRARQRRGWGGSQPIRFQGQHCTADLNDCCTVLLRPFIRRFWSLSSKPSDRIQIGSHARQTWHLFRPAEAACGIRDRGDAAVAFDPHDLLGFDGQHSAWHRIRSQPDQRLVGGMGNLVGHRLPDAAAGSSPGAPSHPRHRAG